MPILERTPPVRRAQVGVEHGPETSSPSRAKFDRNGDKQVNAAPAESEYVFPPLDAMASAMREKSSAITGAARYTPTMFHGENSGASGEPSGSASGGSGRRLLGAGGRNAPVLTATAGKSHPPLGSKVGNRNEQTPPAHDPSRGLISGGDGGITQESGARQPQLPSKDYDHDERPIRSAAVSNNLSTKPTTDSTAFEAQMERALASGANPFQDRKRDQMRGDSTVVASRDSPRPYESPQIDSPRSTTKLQTRTEHAHARSPRPSAKAIPSQAEMHLTPTKTRPTCTHTPDSQKRQQKQLAQLQEVLAARTSQVEKAKAEAEDAKRAMREREMMYKQQYDRIKALERQLKQLQGVKSSNGGEDIDNLAKLVSVASSWEVSRIRFSSDLSKASETRERDIEAVIYRNEVSYMDARRAEAQLDLQGEKLRVKDLRRKEEVLLTKVQMLEESNEEERRRDAVVKDEFNELLAEMENGTKEKASVEKELRLMKLKYEEERKKAVTASEQLFALEGQVRSSRRNQEEADDVGTPIQQQKKQKPKFTRETDLMKQQKMVEPVRQSPRKAAVSAAIKSTISSVRAPSTSKQAAAAAQKAREEEQGMDTFDDIETIAPLAAPIVAREPAQKKATKQRVVPPSEEIDEASEDGGDDYQVARKPVKKSSILSRGKKPAVKEAVKTIGKTAISTVDDDAEMQRQVEQTPMLVSKKRKPSVTQANEEAEEEEEVDEREDSLDVDVTPVVKPRKKAVKKGDKEKPGRRVEEEDTSLVGTRTPMVPMKRPAMQQQQQQQQHDNSSSTQNRPAATTAVAPATSAPEVKKKKRRLLKPNTNVANNFFSANGDEEGDLDPKLNLPLQLSPVKGGNGGSDGITKSSSSALLGGQRGMSAAASRIFRR